MTTARSPVQLVPVARHPRMLLIPVLLMLLLSSARLVCRLVQSLIPLTGLLVPLPVPEAVRLSAHRVR